MNNKKVGVFILVITVFLLGVFVLVIQSLNQEIKALGCFENAGCKTIETSLGIVHFAFGAFGFLFALAFYLLIFSKGEEAIVERLEKDTERKLGEEKYSILSKGLNEFEKRVLAVVRQEEGITQNMLRLRVDMSKAKVSQVLQELEKKSLIKREPKDKTLQIFLKEKL
ncbi:MAG TPA: MarR family transcriptional regulator [Candidatus Nanoarchaeia archaeon]|nr:MarR family transcriptional regulator [Candidatus Nanoarchaeia archaeon]